MEARKKAGTVATLASAIVHAANMGAKVINISVTACVSAADPLDQSAIGAAVWYAATVKDAVIVAAAGNEGEDECAQNPGFDPLDTSDPRDWHQVKTVSSPSWFSDYVLSVGAVDNTGAPVSKSLSGPWVAAAAPGVGIMGLSPQTGGPVNAYPPIRPGEKNMPFWGTSFSAAYVSGVAALVRAKYPALSAHQIVNRILQTAHNPPRGVDNQVGYGVVDPVAALTFNVPPGDRLAPGAQSRVIVPAAPPPPPDHRARNVALGVRRPGGRRGGDRVACCTGSARAMTATIRLAIIVGVLATGLIGWAIGGYPGAAVGLALAVAAGVIRWRGQPLWSWLMLWRQRGRAITVERTHHGGQRPCRRWSPLPGRRRGGGRAVARQGASADPVHRVDGDIYREHRRRRRPVAAAASEPGFGDRFAQRGQRRGPAA